MNRKPCVTRSIRTLSDFVDFGVTWWAPIPDTRYKSQDGRDLNLEVICAMMVSDYPYLTTFSFKLSFFYMIELVAFARLNTGHMIHLIL
jgi:hypothetical protein